MDQRWTAPEAAPPATKVPQGLAARQRSGSGAWLRTLTWSLDQVQACTAPLELWQATKWSRPTRARPFTVQALDL